ncbi:MAG: hypothetical protein NC392_14235 [Roseburia sp.]|nr:hypothetical protein [Roseburia sp.]
MALRVKSITKPPIEDQQNDNTQKEYIMDGWDDTSMLFRVDDIYKSLNL